MHGLARSLEGASFHYGWWYLGNANRCVGKGNHNDYYPNGIELNQRNIIGKEVDDDKAENTSD